MIQEYQIYHFTNPTNVSLDGEHIVISDQPHQAVLDACEIDGFKLRSVRRIIGDCAGMPCDRELNP